MRKKYLAVVMDVIIYQVDLYLYSSLFFGDSVKYKFRCIGSGGGVGPLPTAEGDILAAQLLAAVYGTREIGTGE